MARLKKLEVGALNVKTHPHSPETYIRLFRDAYRAGIVANIRGDDLGMIGTLSEKKQDDRQILTGYLYKFMNIDPEEPWLNLKTRKPIATDEGEPIPQVPDHLKPNLRDVRYLFDSKHHRFFFESSRLTPGNARRLLAGIFADRQIVKTYGPVDVELETSQEVLTRILAIPTLTRLEIMVSRANQDDISGQTERVMERLERQGVRRLEENLTSAKGESIRPDDETKGLMMAATSNGRITAIGYDQQEQKMVESTEKHPVAEQVFYNPGIEDPIRVFMEAASKLMRKILGRK